MSLITTPSQLVPMNRLWFIKLLLYLNDEYVGFTDGLQTEDNNIMRAFQRSAAQYQRLICILQDYFNKVAGSLHLFWYFSHIFQLTSNVRNKHDPIKLWTEKRFWMILDEPSINSLIPLHLFDSFFNAKLSLDHLNPIFSEMLVLYQK